MKSQQLRQLTKSDAQSLSKTVADFGTPIGSDLIARTKPFLAWQQECRSLRSWQYTCTIDARPQPEMGISNEERVRVKGVNYASQDYLGLTSHPAIHDAAIKALTDFGPHSAGSPVLCGNTRLSQDVESELGALLKCEHVALFATGWQAGFGTIVGLVRPDDYILIDILAHACLKAGTYAATRNVQSVAHLDPGSIEARLRRIRSKDVTNGILVVTEGLFSMDSDTPDIRAIQEVCTRYGATLLVDIAHDLGCMGANGGGVLEIQGLLGHVDLVLGSFSKTFASNGGFIASGSESVKQFIKFYSNSQPFSNALSPIQAGVVRKAISIVRSTEGRELRGRLHGAAECLRTEVQLRGMTVLGNTSPIVPVLAGSEALGRVSSGLLFEKGVFANMVEHPAVPRGRSRFRFQVMASHTAEHASVAANALSESLEEGTRLLAGNTRQAKAY
jgi:glycine C-acetyltransferase